MWQIEIYRVRQRPQTPAGTIKLYSVCKKPKSLCLVGERDSDIDLMWQFHNQRTNRVSQNCCYLTWHPVLWHLLTGQSIDQRWPLIIVFFLRDRAVLPVHLADRSGAFPRDFAAIIFIKQHLVHQIRLHQVGLCRRLRGPVVVTFRSKGREKQRDEGGKERFT